MSSVPDRVLAVVNGLLARVDAAVVRASSSRSGNGAPLHLAAAKCDKSAPDSENAVIHQERTKRLSAMPPGAKTVLSAGCAGRWYFEWLDDAYPGIEQHIGLEAYLPEPGDLPDNVRWVAASVRRMTGVADGSVDLIFSGQNIEHLWAADMVGFLLESRRVLRDGGWLVIDSPNAQMCDALNYLMPEHVAELEPREIIELLGLAGFVDISVKGVWLCFDGDAHMLLPLVPNRVLAGWAAEQRCSAAIERPDDSLVWWAEARAAAKPRVAELVAAVECIVADRYARRLNNPTAPIGRIVGRGDRRWSSVEAGQVGILLRGPRAPLPPGEHRLTFWLRAGRAPDGAVVARLDAYSSTTQTVLATRSLTSADFRSAALQPFELPVVLEATAFGVEFRVQATGEAALTTSLSVGVQLDPSVPFYAHEFA